MKKTSLFSFLIFFGRLFLQMRFRLADGKYAIPNPQVLLPSSDPTQLPIGESTYAIPGQLSGSPVFAESRSCGNAERLVCRALVSLARSHGGAVLSRYGECS
jgi:hypothetical protein